MHLLGGITQRKDTRGRGFGILIGWSLDQKFTTFTVTFWWLWSVFPQLVLVVATLCEAPSGHQESGPHSLAVAARCLPSLPHRPPDDINV